MKKQLLSLGLASSLALASVSTQAATLLGFEVGAYTWDTSASGSVDATDVGAANISADAGSVTYFAFEHPVPIVPNVKVQLTDMTASSATENVDLSNTDAILYYEILDNSLVSIDIGITARTFDGSYQINAKNVAMTDTTYLGYAAAMVGIPGTGLSVGMEVQNDIGLDDNTITDTKIRVMYEIAAGFGVELGQRTVNMSLQENASVQTSDLEFDGTYFALTFTF